MKLFNSLSFSLIICFGNAAFAQQLSAGDQGNEKETPPSWVNFSLRNEIDLKPNGVCNPACTNMGFEQGTLDGWDAFYATNTSTETVASFSNLTGGPAGPVTQAGGPDATHNGDYHVRLMPKGVDSVAGGKLPLTPPLGGLCTRVGDSTAAKNGVSRLEQTFNVDPAFPILTLQYAAVLQSGNRATHKGWRQVWMKIELLDANGLPINTCASFTVTAVPGLPGWDSVPVPSSPTYIYIKPWTVAYIPLSAYAGQCVTLRITVSDCAEGGHAGYAYVAAGCSSAKLFSSSKVFCTGQTSATIYAPPGAATYSWTTSNGCISTAPDKPSIDVSCGGNYSVVVTSYAGATCTDSLSLVLPASSSGPPPIACFTSDTVCQGSPTSLNAQCSSPSATKFYWDLYGSGSVFDDSTTGASLSYAFSAGTIYNTRLYVEDANGCGASITNKVVVKQMLNDSMPTVTHTVQNATSCDSANGSVFVTFTGSSSTSYFNFSACKVTQTTTIDRTRNTNCGISQLKCTDDYNGYFGCKLVTYQISGLAPGVYTYWVRPVVPPGTLFCNSTGWMGDSVTVVVGPTVSFAGDFSTTNATCGQADGGACVMPSGGISPYSYSWLSNGATTSCISNVSAGTYILQIKDSTGCMDTVAITVNTTTPPTQPTVLMNGNILTSSDTTAASYQWYFNNIPIANSNSFQYTATQDGCYRVMITDSYGCASTSDNQCILITGFTETRKEVFSIYPNPNNGSFTISFSNASERTVQIFNALGELIYKDAIKGGIASKTFSLSLQQGIYFIEATDAFGHQVSKLMIR